MIRKRKIEFSRLTFSGKSVILNLRQREKAMKRNSTFILGFRKLSGDVRQPRE